jgi:ABC-type uncharacterized transport system permease subunit
MIEALGLFLDATVRTATPLALAALGETVAERAGIINLGIEGALIGGAFGALVGATTFGIAGGLAGAAIGGALVGIVFAAMVVGLRTDQIIAGTAVSMLALGLTGTLYRAMFGSTGAALTIPTLHPVAVPGLSSLPLIGSALFSQPVTTYALYVIAPATSWWMFRTHAGLALRACGESPTTARAAGVRVSLMQFWALLFAGTLGGIGGGVLVLAQSGTFAEGMSAGRGFVAIAIVVLGRWNPLGAVAAALLFGAASALQTLFQALGSSLPYQLFLALPYALTLVALARVGRGSRAPAALARVTDD